MNAIKPDGCIDAINAQAPPPVPNQLPVQVTDTMEPEPVPRQVTPFAAVFWIIAAWLIGTLVSELNVIGAESRPVKTFEVIVDR